MKLTGIKIGMFSLIFLICLIAGWQGSAMFQTTNDGDLGQVGELNPRSNRVPNTNDEDVYSEWCASTFQTIWPLAKKGSLKARFQLLQSMHMNLRYLPGHDDRISYARDVATLFIHAAAYKDDESENTFNALIQYLPAGDPWFKKFLLCIESTSAKECTNQAVKDRLVPSFATFAEEIDFHIQHGKTSICTGFIGDPLSKNKRKDIQ